MRIGDWSSDVCSSDLTGLLHGTSWLGKTCQKVLLMGCLRFGEAYATFDLFVHHLAHRALLQKVAPEQEITGSLQLAAAQRDVERAGGRSEEHTSELQSLMRISYAVFCLKKKK